MTSWRSSDIDRGGTLVIHLYIYMTQVTAVEIVIPTYILRYVRYACYRCQEYLKPPYKHRHTGGINYMIQFFSSQKSFIPRNLVDRV